MAKTGFSAPAGIILDVIPVAQEQLPDSQRSTLHDWDSGGYMKEALNPKP